MVELIDEAQLLIAKTGLGLAVPVVDVLPLEQHGAARGVVQRPHQVQQGGLARARAPHHRQHLAGGDAEIYPLEHLGLQIALFIDMVEGLTAQQRLAGLGFIHNRGSTYTGDNIGTGHNAGTRTGGNNRR